MPPTCEDILNSTVDDILDTLTTESASCTTQQCLIDKADAAKTALDAAVEAYANCIAERHTPQAIASPFPM